MIFCRELQMLLFEGSLPLTDMGKCMFDGYPFGFTTHCWSDENTERE
jgi:hypothetical protein